MNTCVELIPPPPVAVYRDPLDPNHFFAALEFFEPEHDLTSCHDSVEG